MGKETLFEIGQSIEQHYKKERQNKASIFAIGRAIGYMEATFPQRGVPNKEIVTLWIVNQPMNKRNSVYQGDGFPVYKNTKIGEILTKYYQGLHSYSVKTDTKKENKVSINLYNKATFYPRANSIDDVTVWLAGDEEIYRYRTIKCLLQEQKALDEKTKELEKLRKQEEENKRLEEERKKQEKAQQIKEEIEQLENEITRSKVKIARTRSFIRNSVTLRLQPLLDIYQEEAKRSHLYDGISIIIEGGPGTGKTTTVIQRLKFLTSKDALNDYDVALFKEQIDLLTNENNKSWQFVSPTKLLLQYLRRNMQEEGLRSNDENTVEIDSFRKKMVREYGLRMPDRDGPFKIYKIEGKYSALILQPREVVDRFGKYVTQQITKNLVEASKLETKSYSWHDKAVRIKSYCTKAKNIKDIYALLDLFYSLQDNERSYVEELVSTAREKIKELSVYFKNKIKSQPEICDKIENLFTQWRKEKISDEEDSDEEEEILSKDVNFEVELFDKLQPLIRSYALTLIDSTFKLSKRQNELFILVGSFLQEKQDWSVLGGQMWFIRKYANLCRGVERNVLNKIPQLYKGFRKEIEKDEAQRLYDKELLKKLIKKEFNKHLHPDEQNLLLGFINNLLLDIYRKSKDRFHTLNHSYASSYKNYSKPVIVIDEATDYTQLDYYMLYSFRYYEMSSITLSGDIMQGLNEYGINSWDELNWIIPNLKKYELQTSYRQLPTLLQVAKEMYKDDQGVYPNYKSYMKPSNDEPLPLAFISENENEKVTWISDRIKDVYNIYGNMPSVALFVGDNEDIDELIECFEELDTLNGINVMNCSGNHMLEAKDTVRIFRLSEVKGMEFEVAFFHNIDKAVENENSGELMRRYLYVGISRATTHLAATFTKREGNENVLKYFRLNSDWNI